MFEGDTENSPTEGYGLAIDDMVIEWQEAHPVPQVGAACDYGSADDGQCAVLSLPALSLFEASVLVPVTVIDFNAESTSQAVCASGFCTVEVLATSEAERDGEVITLTAPMGDPAYRGSVKTSTTIRQPDDGVVYLQANGIDVPSLTVSYIDENDGARGTDAGPDGLPGVAGLDDDGDGTVDEADELCPEGVPARWSDDTCGCRDNPIRAVIPVFYDTVDLQVVSVRVDDAVGLDVKNDGDGFPDDGETIEMDIEVRNLSDFDIEDAVVALGTEYENVACMTDTTAAYGTIPGKAAAAPDTTVLNPPSDRFGFVVGEARRTHVTQEVRAGFSLSVTGTAVVGDVRVPIHGTATLQEFHLDLDLDASGFTGPATGTWVEDFDYDGEAAWEAKWAHGFDTDQDGNRCPYSDNTKPLSNTWPDHLCPLGMERGFKEKWHLHNSSVIGLPDGGRSGDSDPRRSSMHLGLHAGGPPDDTIYLNQMRWACGPAAAVRLGLGRAGVDDPPALSFWHQLSISDDRLFDNVAPPVTMDGAVVFVREVGAADWEKIEPWLGPPLQQRSSAFINCQWDPIDDGSDEDDVWPNTDERLGPSSTCFPEFSWGCVGLTVNPPCLAAQYCYDEVHCYPETGLPAEGFRNPDPTQPGVWIEARYDLQRFRGRAVQVRFLVAPSELEGDTVTEVFGGLPFGYNRDDGWYIDDIRVTGVTTDEITLSVDTRDATAECPSHSCWAISNLIVDPDRDGTAGAPFGSDAPGRTHTLDSSSSTLTDCVDGAPEWRFWGDVDKNGVGDILLRDWLSDPFHAVNPSQTTGYVVEFRCSNTEVFPTCRDSLDACIKVITDPTFCGESFPPPGGGREPGPAS